MTMIVVCKWKKLPNVGMILVHSVCLGGPLKPVDSRPLFYKKNYSVFHFYTNFELRVAASVFKKDFIDIDSSASEFTLMNKNKYEISTCI